MSTYSPDLRLTLIGTGEQAGTWGTTTNNNYQYGFENAITGFFEKTISSTSASILVTDGAQTSGEYPQANYKLSGTPGGTFSLFLPPYQNKYTIYNNTANNAYLRCATIAGQTTAAATGTATIVSGSTSINITALDTGVKVAIGMLVVGAVTGIPANTVIVGKGTGTGDTGTYTLSNAATVSTSLSITFRMILAPGYTTTVFTDGINVYDGSNRINGNLLVGGNSTFNNDAIISGTATVAGNSAFTSNGSLGIPVGTTADRVVSTAGSAGIRYNTTLSRFEGYDINNTTWNTIGGGATGGGANQVFYENGQQITANYTVPVGKNAMTTGPVTIISFSGTGTTATNILTITGAPTGSLYIGAVIAGTGITVGTTITAFGTGTGGAGTYTLSNTIGTLTSRTITSDVVVTVSNGSYLTVI
jgi:hypothetical protein